MVLFAVALTCWVLLSLPVAVLLGRCIERGLAPPATVAGLPDPTSPGVPMQRQAPYGVTALRAELQAGRIQA